MPWEIITPLLFVAPRISPCPAAVGEAALKKLFPRTNSISGFYSFLEWPQPLFIQLFLINHLARAGKPPGIFNLIEFEQKRCFSSMTAFTSSQIIQKIKICAKKNGLHWLICPSTNAQKSWIHSCPNVRKLPQKSALCRCSLVHTDWLMNISPMEHILQCFKISLSTYIRVWGIATSFIIKRGLFF